jgi:hypothetical protein
MFGPVFDAKAQAVWDVAKSGASSGTSSVLVQPLGSSG